jgi:hypothetical protein
MFGISGSEGRDPGCLAHVVIIRTIDEQLVVRRGIARRKDASPGASTISATVDAGNEISDRDQYDTTSMNSLGIGIPLIQGSYHHRSGPLQVNRKSAVSVGVIGNPLCRCNIDPCAVIDVVLHHITGSSIVGTTDTKP